MWKTRKNWKNSLMEWPFWLCFFMLFNLISKPKVCKIVNCKTKKRNIFKKIQTISTVHKCTLNTNTKKKKKIKKFRLWMTPICDLLCENLQSNAIYNLELIYQLVCQFLTIKFDKKKRFIKKFKIAKRLGWYRRSNKTPKFKFFLTKENRNQNFVHLSLNWFVMETTMERSINLKITWHEYMRGSRILLFND